jgi:hypothetical protein
MFPDLGGFIEFLVWSIKIMAVLLVIFVPLGVWKLTELLGMF